MSRATPKMIAELSPTRTPSWLNASSMSETFVRPLALKRAAAGERVVVRRVEGDEAAALAYLRERGLVPGALLEVTEARALDGVVTVEDERGRACSLGPALAGSIFVRDPA